VSSSSIGKGKRYASPSFSPVKSSDIPDDLIEYLWLDEEERVVVASGGTILCEEKYTDLDVFFSAHPEARRLISKKSKLKSDYKKDKKKMNLEELHGRVAIESQIAEEIINQLHTGQLGKKEFDFSRCSYAVGEWIHNLVEDPVLGFGEFSVKSYETREGKRILQFFVQLSTEIGSKQYDDPFYSGTTKALSNVTIIFFTDGTGRVWSGSQLSWLFKAKLKSE